MKAIAATITIAFREHRKQSRAPGAWTRRKRDQTHDHNCENNETERADERDHLGFERGQKDFHTSLFRRRLAGRSGRRCLRLDRNTDVQRRRLSPELLARFVDRLIRLLDFSPGLFLGEHAFFVALGLSFCGFFSAAGERQCGENEQSDVQAIFHLADFF
jgi:hypothetical protein